MGVLHEKSECVHALLSPAASGMELMIEIVRVVQHHWDSLSPKLNKREMVKEAI
jgi:hypothetical protein